MCDLTRLNRWTLAVLVCFFLAGPRVFASEPQKAEAGAAAAEMLRGWLSQGDAAHSAAAPLAQPPTQSGAAELRAWQDYIDATALQDPAAREKRLHALYPRTRSPLLRAVILRAIGEDPTFQSRQAQFIRKYGFYANWFNRLAYSGAQVIQGNVQASLQLLVDGVNDLFHPSEAGPLDRRAYDMLQRSRDAHADPKQTRQLENAVARALAQADLDSAQYTLKSGDPEAAAFYARQAATTCPDWTRAKKLALAAEAEAAHQRRESVASEQVGYPDRAPPFDPAQPELLRAILAGTDPSRARPKPEERLVVSVLGTVPKPGAGRSTMMRGWESLLKKDQSAPPYPQRWLRATIGAPGANPDERLAEARSNRRGQMTRFIFLGDERPRDRVYKAASWVAATWDAFQNIGLFYVFDVLIRGGQSLFKPPAPADEVLDAEGRWLRGAPNLQAPEARRIGKDMAATCLRLERFEDARRILAGVSALDPSAKQKIDMAEAHALIQTAKTLSASPERKATLARAKALAPGTRLARNAEKFATPDVKKMPPERLQLDWETLRQWTRLPPPCGLPGERQWFDGQAGNGEITAQGPLFERKKPDAPISVRYPVKQGWLTWTRRYELAPGAVPPGIKRWFDLASRQESEASEAIAQLHRLPIPFQIEGGAGPTGMDVYPKLLPIQPKPGQIELYQ